ncbi:MAG TPA: PhzF family phenazine biosynthesis protein [Candidatus Baltobacteraceae bacterium]
MPYVVVDVFTEVPLRGNPLAVFPDARGLDDAQMQAIARELNLSETSFVFPPNDGQSVARLRIFTPSAEVPFAGHPTIGTAFVLVSNGTVAPEATSFVLNERIGNVPIRLERRADPFLVWFTGPPIVLGAYADRMACVRALGLDIDDCLDDLPAQFISGGNTFLYIPLRDRATVDRAKLIVDAMARAGAGEMGVYVFSTTPNGVYARLFAPYFGIAEDPATGSAMGPLAAYLFEHNLIERKDGLRLVSEQGAAMGRRSILHMQLHVDGSTLAGVEVGGSAVPIIEGTIQLA